jgi:hypothetical protein
MHYILDLMEDGKMTIELKSISRHKKKLTW